ncbi:hypothetical protein ACIQUB_22265 [Rhizobium sp. NPDC090275]
MPRRWGSVFPTDIDGAAVDSSDNALVDQLLLLPVKLCLSIALASTAR